MANQVWMDGKLVPAEQATVSVFDHGLLYGDGVFEGIRCYNGRVFKLMTHLRRLYDSAKAIRLEIPYTIAELAEATRQTLNANGLNDSYIRLCVTRGPGALGINPFTCARAGVFIITDKISLYPPEHYSKGIEVITATTIRNHPAALSPRIKSMNYLNNILAKMEALDAGLMEAIMLNHQGFVAEGTADNVFIVRHHNGKEDQPTLVTPPLHAGALEGVTRNVVIDLARQAGIEFVHAELTQHDLYIANEMFLTGTAAELIPVTRIDGRDVGHGKPGAVTARLIDSFHQLVAHNAPED